MKIRICPSLRSFALSQPYTETQKRARNECLLHMGQKAHTKEKLARLRCSQWSTPESRDQGSGCLFAFSPSVANSADFRGKVRGRYAGEFARLCRPAQPRRLKKSYREFSF